MMQIGKNASALPWMDCCLDFSCNCFDLLDFDILCFQIYGLLERKLCLAGKDVGGGVVGLANFEEDPKICWLP